MSTCQNTNVDMVKALSDRLNTRSYQFGQALGIIECLLDELSANKASKNSCIEHAVKFLNENSNIWKDYDYKK